MRAFQRVLGLESLPRSGDEVPKFTARYTAGLLAALGPAPGMEPLVDAAEAASPAHHPRLPRAWRQHFVDLTTGVRMRYLSWPHAGEDVILLLHGLAGSADACAALGDRLSDRGYTVYALDLRGHGGTGRSLSGRYDAAHLAEDVSAFVLAKDLYVRPLAVVGAGIGAAVALALAAASPRLVGAVACLDFGLPAALGEAGDGAQAAELLPWWSFWLGQGAKFPSTAECAALLAGPMVNLGPGALPALGDALAAEAGDAPAGATPPPAQELGKVLSRLKRSPKAAARDAVAMLRPAAGPGGRAFTDDPFPLMEPKIDPKFFFNFDIKSFRRGVAAFGAHLLVLHGERSAMVPAGDATALAALPRAPASVTVVQVAGAGHHLLYDAPRDVYDALVAFLEGPAVQAFEPGGGAGGRRPETLGLRPLPDYSTLEAAHKALGPRAIPTAEAVEAELQALRVAEGRGAGEASDDEEGGGSGQATGLARDPADYFGFIG